ncbi:replication protein/endonuclease [Yersinia phage vB_YpM_MHG96]
MDGGKLNAQTVCGLGISEATQLTVDRHATTKAGYRNSKWNGASPSDTQSYLTGLWARFPRHACPLYGAVLMQLHDHSGSAPALEAHDQNWQPLRMQNNAPVACTAKKRGNRGKMA